MDQAIVISLALLQKRKKPDVLLRVKPNSTYSFYVNLKNLFWPAQPLARRQPIAREVVLISLQ
jgi:hypothetical protein